MYQGLEIIYRSKRKGEVAALVEIPLVVETAVWTDKDATVEVTTVVESQKRKTYVSFTHVHSCWHVIQVWRED